MKELIIYLTYIVLFFICQGVSLNFLKNRNVFSSRLEDIDAFLQYWKNIGVAALFAICFGLYGSTGEFDIIKANTFGIAGMVLGFLVSTIHTFKN